MLSQVLRMINFIYGCSPEAIWRCGTICIVRYGPLPIRKIGSKCTGNPQITLIEGLKSNEPELKWINSGKALSAPQVDYKRITLYNHHYRTVASRSNEINYSICNMVKLLETPKAYTTKLGYNIAPMAKTKNLGMFARTMHNIIVHQ